MKLNERFGKVNKSNEVILIVILSSKMEKVQLLCQSIYLTLYQLQLIKRFAT